MKKKLSELKLGEVFKFEDKPDLYHFAGKKDDLYKRSVKPTNRFLRWLDMSDLTL